jgi:hypothetical protein
MKETTLANRALNHARMIASASPGRGSATRAEAQAAEYVRKYLTGLGLPHLKSQPFTGSRSIWFFLALVFGTTIMAHLAMALLLPAIGDWPAWGISALLFGFGFYLLWRKFSFRDHPFQELLPRGPSQNVIAVLPPKEQVLHRVVLMAHLDSHRAVIWFANDVLVLIYTLLTPIILYGILAAPLFYALALATGLQVFTWFGIGLAFLHFVAWFTGVTADLGAFSPGANDNASSAGIVLSLAEYFQQSPLQHTEVWCLFTGCEESGGDGIRAFLKEHEQLVKDAFFLDFELTGIGERLVYLENEGVLRRRSVPHQTRNLLKSYQEDSIQPFRWGISGAYTEMGAIWEKGYQGVCLMMLQEDKTLLPEWHRISDTPERLEINALQKVQEFTRAFLDHIDQSAL